MNDKLTTETVVISREDLETLVKGMWDVQSYISRTTGEVVTTDQEWAVVQRLAAQYGITLKK